MAELSLSYGDASFPFLFDQDHFKVIVPHRDSNRSGEEYLIDSLPLTECTKGKRVLVVVSDLTRPTGACEFLPRLLPQVKHATKVSIIFATGLHRPLENKDKVEIVGREIFNAYPMLDHRPEVGNVFLGTTSLGNRVEIDQKVLDNEIIVLTGSITFHYFAGFSGGRKSLLPGLASKESIHFNHLLLMNQGGSGRDSAVRVAHLDGNPVHEDMMEAARLVDRELFVYNTIMSSGKIKKTFSGHWAEAHRRGAADYLASHSVELEGKRPLAIVSCGGFPRDINMIQAHKALEFAQYAVEPGGTIILIAECREGTGHASFYPWFSYSDLDEFERELRSNYEVYGQTAYSVLSKARRFRIICVSELPDQQVFTMGMEPASSLDDAMSMVDLQPSDKCGYVIPSGTEVLPVISSV